MIKVTVMVTVQPGGRVIKSSFESVESSTCHGRGTRPVSALWLIKRV